MIRRNIAGLRLFGLTASLLAVIPTLAQGAPANWKNFNTAFYTVSYPPTWHVAQEPDNQSHIQFQSPDSPYLTIEVEHSTAYGSDIESMFAAEKANLRKVASDNRINVTFDLETTGLRGGSSVQASFNTASGIIWYVTVNGVAIGKSIFITRFTTVPAESYANFENYYRPISNSILFHPPASSIAGNYTAHSTSDSMGGKAVTKRDYTATLSFDSSGTYTYVVDQKQIPTWNLRVSGNWAITDPTPIDVYASGQITLRPVTTQFTGAGLSDSDRASELQRLVYEGYATNVVESFEISTPAIGGLDVKRLSGGPGVHYAQTSAPPESATFQAVDAAAFSQGPVAPGSLVSLFGSFGVEQAAASALPLPATLSQLSVTVGGRTAPLLFVGPNQVNIQVPFETIDGTAQIVVTKGAAKLASTTIGIIRSAPKLFVPQANHAVAANQDYSLNSSTNPARAGSYIAVYLTGQGALHNAVANGAAAPSSPLALTSATTTATVGGRAAAVAFSGGAPGFAGVAQVNVQIPSGLARGDYPLIITIGGVASNTANISVTP